MNDHPGSSPMPRTLSSGADTGENSQQAAVPETEQQAAFCGSNGEIQPQNGRHWLRRFLERSLGKGTREDKLRETLENLIEESEADPADSASSAGHERMLLGNILKLRDLTVTDVMVPRVDIAAIEASAPLDDVLQIASSQPHSRFPIYQESLDRVLGFIHIKDLLQSLSDPKRFQLKSITREVMIIAPSMRILDLLVEMRARRSHLALVVDEFGGIDGLVTIEDLVEEITGEIEDEHDFTSAPTLRPQKNGTYLADARLELADFESALQERMGGAFLEEDEREEVDTLGGLVFHLTGEIPSRGALIKHGSGIEFEVLEADPRRIRRLRIRPPQ